MKRTDLSQAACPIARTLDVVGDFWSLLLVRDAMRGKRRFGEFQKSLGLAKNLLMVPAEDGSSFQEYVLTSKGQALKPVLRALRIWGEAHTSEA
jgi:DNA-binding HxlR family transcriptional regulator